jgi:hypothetical protein
MHSFYRRRQDIYDLGDEMDGCPDNSQLHKIYKRLEKSFCKNLRNLSYANIVSLVSRFFIIYQKSSQSYRLSYTVRAVKTLDYPTNHHIKTNLIRGIHEI